MTWKIEEYPVRQLISGEQLKLRTYTLVGASSGPHVHIQAGIHGAELQGNAVILRLMERLRATHVFGSITLVPLCNPYAVNTKMGPYTYGRFNPVTGNNWNRNYLDIGAEDFKAELHNFAATHRDTPWPELARRFRHFLATSYDALEKSLAELGKLNDNNQLNLLLQRLASKADVVLDLHTGPCATRYLYCADFQMDLAKYLLMDHVLVIPGQFFGAMEEASFMPWIHLCQALKHYGRKESPDIASFTLEFGSEESFSMIQAREDALSIENFLAFKGVIKQPFSAVSPKFCLIKDFLTIYAPTGGLCDFYFSPGQRFCQGDILASIYSFAELDPRNPLESAQHDIVAPCDGIVINHTPSSALHQGMEVYQIMTQVFEHERF